MTVSVEKFLTNIPYHLYTFLFWKTDENFSCFIILRSPLLCTFSFHMFHAADSFLGYLPICDFVALRELSSINCCGGSEGRGRTSAVNSP